MTVRNVSPKKENSTLPFIPPFELFCDTRNNDFSRLLNRENICVKIIYIHSNNNTCVIMIRSFLLPFFFFRALLMMPPCDILYGMMDINSSAQSSRKRSLNEVKNSGYIAIKKIASWA